MGGLLYTRNKDSVKVKLHLNSNRNRNRPAVFHSWLEGPSLYRFNGLFIQSQTKRTRYVDIAGSSIGSHDQVQNASSLIFRLAGFF